MMMEREKLREDVDQLVMHWLVHGDGALKMVREMFDKQTEGLMAKIQVRRARTMTKAASSLERNQTRPYNWVVRQPVGGGTRVFIYKNARLARLNADKLARTGCIGNLGLRGFHIEYD